MPRSEGIETYSGWLNCAACIFPERMPRSEGIETLYLIACFWPCGNPGTNAPIRGD